MPVLPPRPYPIATQFFVRRILGVILCVGGGLAMAIGGANWQLGEARQLRADEQLWRDGASDHNPGVQGRETSHHFIANVYDLDVDYRDGAMRPHRAKVEFTLLFASVENRSPATVKYDPANPERFVLSWAIEHAGARWAGIALFMTMMVGFGGLFVWLGYMIVKQMSFVRAIAERSEEVTLKLLYSSPVHVNGQHTATNYHYEAASDGKTVKAIAEQLPKKEAPLFADPERSQMVALVSPYFPAKRWLVRSNLYPFVLTQEQRTEVMKKAGV